MSCSVCGIKSSGKSGGGCGSGGCATNGCSTGGCNKLNTFDWLSDFVIPTNGYRYNIFEITFKNGVRKGFYRLNKRFDVSTGDYVSVTTRTGGFDVGKISLSGELVKLQMKKKRISDDSDRILDIIRISNDNDIESLEQARAGEFEMLVQARAIARSLKLDMKISDVELQADRKKATFYYIADDRVDFRELIKEYAKAFKIKIEMRQIGARQETALIGGIGSCGRELCCSTWLTDFKSVNTAAARYQNLSINQSKLSGQCGRLKCCLNFELDIYLDYLKAFPQNAELLQFERTKAKLVKTDVFQKQMYYRVDSDNKFYVLPIDAVSAIQALNSKGKFPASITDFAVKAESAGEEENNDLESVDAVLDLKTLDKKEREKRQQNRNNQSNNSGRNNYQPRNSSQNPSSSSNQRNTPNRNSNRNQSPTNEPNQPPQNRPPQRPQNNRPSSTSRPNESRRPNNPNNQNNQPNKPPKNEN